MAAHRMARLSFLSVAAAFLLAPGVSAGAAQVDAPITLHDTVRPSALHDARRKEVIIRGRVRRGLAATVRIRVTTSHGVSSIAQADARSGRFQSRYPQDFVAAPPLATCFLFVDATTDADFGCPPPTGNRAEATLLVFDGRRGLLPEFPSAFTSDLLDRRGRTDATCAEWPTIRTLVNLYMRSRAAHLCGLGRRNFDLARRADLAFFKNNLTLYEFDRRDRDWSGPLSRRVRRTFWQSVWNTWFNASNNNPTDGNDANGDPSNYVPYAFTNDFADILTCYLMRLDLPGALDDNLDAICREGIANLLAMQHRDEGNFARPDRKGRQHTYTTGAFRYGMFENGEWMTEGTGWFYNPTHSDYLSGGVFNGRAIWTLGEALKRYPRGPMADRIKDAIRIGLRFCLHDALQYGYARRTRGGHAYWYDPGETGYLLLGMLAACEVAPDLRMTWRSDGADPTLRDLCADVLDALVDLVKPHKQWQIYADKDSMAIAAVADAARILPDHPRASRWRRTAIAVGDAWLAARPDPSQYPAPLVHIGQRRTGPDRLSFLWGWNERSPGRTFIFLYASGHWIHALAKLYGLTGDSRYRERAEAMVSYLCGANPWRVRLLNEIGGVYNWVEDKDGDGIEDELKQDMYPESTAFCQIGINHLMRSILARRPSAD